MKKRFFSFCLILLLSFVSLGQAEPQDGQGPLVLANVNVIDATGAPMKVNMTVVIEDGRIAEIGESATIRPPQGARIIEARGKYLIPGLWDMHIHWYHEGFLPLFIANGVTGARQMSGFPFHLEWREKAARGDLLAPRLAIASAIVDGPGSMWPGSIQIANEKDAREAVQEIKSSGFDFIKIYGALPQEAFYALADEAAKQGFVFVGHVPHSVSALEASDAGQKSIEHLTGVLEACSPVGGEIRQGYVKNAAGVTSQKGIDKARVQVMRSLIERLLATYDKKIAAALFARFAKNGTWQCPTFTANRAIAFLGDADFRNDTRLKYMPAYFRSNWQPKNNPLFASRTADDYTPYKSRYQKQMKTAGEMRRAGVKFLAGTDIGNPFCFPGFSLHDELALLVEAEFTPMEALQAATLNAAIFLGKAESFGTVEKGKIADLVLLEANPLERIDNTRKIAAVILGGELFEKLQLEAMLTNAEKLANQQSIAGALKKTIEEQDVAAAVRQYYDLKTQEPDAYDFSEYELDWLGYYLLKAKKVKNAIEIFKLNVFAYPRSSNVYDSLGKAYMVDGDKENAIASYTRSLELDPRNTNAVEMLKKLGK